MAQGLTFFYQPVRSWVIGLTAARGVTLSCPGAESSVDQFVAEDYCVHVEKPRWVLAATSCLFVRASVYYVCVRVCV